MRLWGFLLAGFILIVEATASDNPPLRKLSFTVSPLWAIAGIGDLSVEYRPVFSWGVVGNTMLGEFNLDSYRGKSSDDGTFHVGGVQLRRYLNPGGSHLAGEVSYWRIDADAASSGGIEGRVEQWRAGALMGYKTISRVGMTLDIQGGAYYALRHYKSGAESGFGDPPRVGPIVRVNLGWSF